jgi:hypothetical protein
VAGPTVGRFLDGATVERRGLRRPGSPVSLSQLIAVIRPCNTDRPRTTRSSRGNALDSGRLRD